MSRDAGTRTRGCCLPVPAGLPQQRAQWLADLYKAAGDPTRLQMLHMLQEAGAPLCVCDFTRVFGVSQPTVSHHLSRLRDAGFLSAERRGIWTYYSLRRDLPVPARALLETLRA